MKYTIEIDDNCPPIEPHEFDSMAKASDYALAYAMDEYAENHEPATDPRGRPFLQRDFIAAVGLLNTGFAQGGNFSVAFQGETIRVKVVYDNLDEMMQVLLEAERFGIDQDPEGADAQNDLEDYIAKRRNALANFGDPAGKWSMVVDTSVYDPEDIVYGTTARWNGEYGVMWCAEDGRVTWDAVLGVVSAWQVK